MSAKPNLTHLDHLQRTLHDPRNHLNWLMLGWSAENPKIALEFFQEALVLKPGDPVVIDSIAWAKESIENPGRFINYEGKSEAVQQLQALRPPAPDIGGKTRPIPRSRNIYWRVLVSRRMLLGWMVFYLSLITLAEILTSIIHTMALGLVFHGSVLLMLVVQSAVVVSRREQRLFLTLAFAPLIRMVSLSIPLQNLPQVYWYMLIGIPLFIAAFLMMRYADFSLQEVGLTLKRWPSQLLIGLLGIGLGYLEYLILRPQPLVSELTLTALWLPALILLIFTGLLEEYIFRGLMQRAFIPLFGTVAGVLYVSLIFSVLHFGYKSALDAIFVFWAAVIFSAITLYTGSILGVTLAHGLTNITLFLVFPIILASPLPVGDPVRSVSPTPIVETTPTPFQPIILDITPSVTPSAQAIEVFPSTATPSATPSPTGQE